MDTKAALREALDASGDIERIKAQLRAAVFHSLDGSSPETTKIRATPENTLINEMIREYLQFSGYEHTLSVFTSEAQLPRTTLPRPVVASEMGVPGAPSEIPVLYALVEEGKRHQQDQ